MMMTITIVFLLGILLGAAAGYRSGWNAHVDQKMTEAIQKATDVAESERR